MKKAMITSNLESALKRFDVLQERMRGKELVIFLDYDGTLSPIVPRPEDAILPPGMGDVLRAVAERYVVAAVSGRDLRDVKERIGLEALYYAGSHGFDIEGPEGLKKQHPEALAMIPALDQAEKEMGELIRQWPGAQVERKRFSLALHYRNVADGRHAEAQKGIEEACKKYTNLKMGGGKKVVDLRPDVDWHKGKALLWLLDKMPVKGKGVFSLYLGDDLTDEDAFHVLEEDGVGIVVRDEPRMTFADYALENVKEVEMFLRKLVL